MNTLKVTCTDHGGEIEVTGIRDFDLVRTFECGQCFRWEAEAGEGAAYTGVAMGRAVRVRQVGDSLFISGTAEDFENVWRGYFDLDRDYGAILRDLSLVDDFMQKAAIYGAGIRILRQDPWEALCSFIISQRNNIPRIKGIIAKLCREFGEEAAFSGGTMRASSLTSADVPYYTFPSAEKLAALDPGDLAPIRSGYRAGYVIGAARAVASGAPDLESLARGSSDSAREALKKLRGVGDKVADCAALFGLRQLDAFPRDVWVNRAIARHYGPEFDPAIFSPYAGIAQQCIFHYARNCPLG